MFGWYPTTGTTSPFSWYCTDRSNPVWFTADKWERTNMSMNKEEVRIRVKPFQPQLNSIMGTKVSWTVPQSSKKRQTWIMYHMTKSVLQPIGGCYLILMCLWTEQNQSWWMEATLSSSITHGSSDTGIEKWVGILNWMLISHHDNIL